MAVNGTAVAITTVGGLLLYSAVKGHGIGDTARSLLSGKPVPTASTSPVVFSGANGISQGLNNFASSVTGGGSGTSTYSNSEQYNISVTNAILKKLGGFTRAQRAGIMGNIQAESNFDPNALNSIGAYGICQWLGARRAALKGFARTMGKPDNDLATQLSFMLTELTTDFVHVNVLLRATTTPEQAATVFNNLYEISGDNSGNRQRYAANLYAGSETA